MRYTQYIEGKKPSEANAIVAACTAYPIKNNSNKYENSCDQRVYNSTSTLTQTKMKRMIVPAFVTHDNNIRKILKRKRKMKIK